MARMSHHSETSLYLNVGPGVLPDFMSGTLIYCALAWPTMREGVAFHRVAREMEADVVRKTLREAPEKIAELRSYWPQQDWDILEEHARSKRRTAFGTLHKRLRRRGAAARMGIGLVHDELFGIAATLPPTVTNLSIDQLSNLVRSETDLSHAEDVEKHVWRSSLPIIHLAMAAELMLSGRFADRAGVGCNLEDTEFFEAVVMLGAVLEPVVAKNSKFNITSERQTRVRWLA